MNPARYRHPMTVWRSSAPVYDDDGNDPISERTLVARIRADIQSPYNESDREIGGQLQPIGSYVVTTRTTNIEAADELVWDSRTLQVGTVQRDPLGRWVRLYCSEVISG